MTAQDELKIILAAINARDAETFSARVDLKTLMNLGYDEATEVLAANCAAFHKLYPKDLFFKFGATILALQRKISRRSSGFDWQGYRGLLRRQF